MQCEECKGTAIRVGTKGRGYCKAHEQEAWDQMREEAKIKDARQRNEREEIRVRIYQNHLARAV